MKYLNLLLVVSVVVCYSGFGSKISLSSRQTKTENCHSVQTAKNQDETRDFSSIANYSYGNTDNHENFKCCADVLPNAKNNPSFDLITSFTLNPISPSPENNSYENYPLKFTKLKYQQPDLFLSNSTFLL